VCGCGRWAVRRGRSRTASPSCCSNTPPRCPIRRNSRSSRATSTTHHSSARDRACIRHHRIRRVAGSAPSLLHRQGDDYVVNRDVREMVVFAKHDVLSDPPFSHTDLISCRNLLIYLSATSSVMRSLCSTTHSSQGGVLFLGTSETLDRPDLFSVIDKKCGFFERRDVVLREPPRTAFRSSPFRARTGQDRAPAPPEVGYERLHRSLLERYGPPSMLLDGNNRVVQFSSHVGQYLSHPGGPPTNDAFQLVEDGLRLEMRSVVYAARNEHSVVVGRPVTADDRGHAAHRRDPCRSRRRRRRRPGHVRRGARGVVGGAGHGGIVGRPRRATGGGQSPSRIGDRAVRGEPGGDEGLQRGAAVDERGAAFDVGGTRDVEGGAAVDERGARHPQPGEPTQGRRTRDVVERSAEPADRHRHRHALPRPPSAHRPLHAADHPDLQHPERRPWPTAHRLHQPPRRSATGRRCPRRCSIA
jgi:LSD1 subclass zinc finger protein